MAPPSTFTDTTIITREKTPTSTFTIIMSNASATRTPCQFGCNQCDNLVALPVLASRLDMKKAATASRTTSAGHKVTGARRMWNWGVRKAPWVKTIDEIRPSSSMISIF